MERNYQSDFLSAEMLKTLTDSKKVKVTAIPGAFMPWVECWIFHNIKWVLFYVGSLTWSKLPAFHVDVLWHVWETIQKIAMEFLPVHLGEVWNIGFLPQLGWFKCELHKLCMK